MISSTHSVLSEAAGVAGNLFAFVLFVSPIPTFSRIVRNHSTEQFSGLPYIYTLLNCLICLWYGLPHVSPGIILVATVNSVGAVFQLVYVILFIVYTDKGKKMRMLGLLLSVFGAFAVIAYVSMMFFDSHTRQLFVGCLSVGSLISMFASPLFVIVCLSNAIVHFCFLSSILSLLNFDHVYLPLSTMSSLLNVSVLGLFIDTCFKFFCQNLVIRTKSVEFMPFYLSLATFLMSISFLTYGMLKSDLFIYLPNGIGTILGAIQLSLYAYYRRISSDGAREPLIVSIA